ncbi:N5-glutamine S-adenosyl-L-methionine-dependent methyltransferase [Salmonella enterica subsp. arizonae]|uniref:N5-glutamine S-adenosyl-L-methionine-dependent methyltransferase n=1 Tax=Salmonella enterica subsp. arizonae TaxID=59203 RepID=A0A379TBH1_SALER|nr:N5-glutamine S-adenosyl-L-methionine-dependent methyltransferase [Salmonella enterica subsp. arizonae]
MAFGETPLAATQQQQLAELLRRRKQGEPIAHLTGHTRILVAAAVCFSRHADPAPGYRMSG